MLRPVALWVLLALAVRPCLPSTSPSPPLTTTEMQNVSLSTIPGTTPEKSSPLTTSTSPPPLLTITPPISSSSPPNSSTSPPDSSTSPPESSTSPPSSSTPPPLVSSATPTTFFPVTTGLTETTSPQLTLGPTVVAADEVEGAVWPVKREAVVEGDLVLGGLMMVHEREDSITCGPIMPQGGVQALEAMLYTVDRVNEDKNFFLGFTLGAYVLDDCDKDTYGLEMAVDFIKGSISNIDDAEFHCNKTQVRKVISGVVGAASSVTSIQVANLLRLFKIPQVSFFSTSPELSNKQRFEYFTRTIPSDHYQVKAMVDIVGRMGWKYISILYEESNYGIKVTRPFRKAVSSRFHSIFLTRFFSQKRPSKLIFLMLSLSLLAADVCRDVPLCHFFYSLSLRKAEK
ncbi:probable metabotropic glutamate receptor mgl-1 [Neocloeon triangulifer]|uniref:probable metabotropic glutamate receptor mgl-1 n=1 Tax=Neocloeon triangulifer TaxID=2078957 RepID=UPI00286ED2CD|nr:probable metabotropic glutamate receptor mgl-1 [Neocloeon triangulifer]